MSGYAQVRATALALLRKKGKQVTVTRRPTLKNEITGKLTAGAPLSSKFQGVGLPPGRNAERYIGTLVGKNILQFYLARESAGGIDPYPGDQIEWGGKTYTLVWAAQYDPDDSGVLFTEAYGEA